MKYIINLEKSLSIITNIEVSDAVPRHTYWYQYYIWFLIDWLIVKVRKSLKISKGSQQLEIEDGQDNPMTKSIQWKYTHYGP